MTNRDESMNQRLARLEPADRDVLLRDMGIDPADLDRLVHTWQFQARPSQLPPPDQITEDGTTRTWSYWLTSGGRGAGKTRTGAEFVTERIIDHYHAATNPDHPLHAPATLFHHLVALAGRTGKDIQRAQIRGESGLLAIAKMRGLTSNYGIAVTYQPSYSRVAYYPASDPAPTDDNLIAEALVMSSEEPDQGRGPQYHTAWCDEASSWSNATDEVGNTLWTNITLGLRLPLIPPRAIVTTTPKPVPLIINLFGRANDPDDHSVVLTTASTRANIANLAPSFVEEVYNQYGGTRLARQELDGILLLDFDGTLWTNAHLTTAHTLTAHATRTAA